MFVGANGQLYSPFAERKWDSLHTLRNGLVRSISVASTALMIDEVLRAGKSVKKDQ